MKNLRKSRKVSMAAGIFAAIFAAGGLVGCFIPAKVFFAVMAVAGFAVAGLIWYGFTGYEDNVKKTKESNKGKGGITPENHNHQEEVGASVANAGKGYKIG